MANDDKQYGYDELRWLASDTRKARRRAIWWTAGLSLGAIALATAYVSSSPTHSSGGGPVGPVVPVGPDGPPPIELSTDLRTIPASLEQISASLGNIEGILRNLSGEPPIGVTVNVEVQPGGVVGSSQDYLSNVVWLVDGTRRFPMALGDVLWIRELDMSIRLTRIGTEATDPPVEPAVATQFATLPDGPGATPQTITLPWRRATVLGQLGNSNCAELNSRGPSQRAGFRGAGYVDIEVEFFNAQDENRPCTNPFR